MVSWENHWHKWGLTVEWNIDCFQLILSTPLEMTPWFAIGFPSPGVPKIAVVFFRFFGRSRENRLLSYPLIQLSNADDLGKLQYFTNLNLAAIWGSFPCKNTIFPVRDGDTDLSNGDGWSMLIPGWRSTFPKDTYLSVCGSNPSSHAKQNFNMIKPGYIRLYTHILAGGIPTPVKNMKVSWDDDIPNWMESH